jgi:CheY-like chemotaxis protein
MDTVSLPAPMPHLPHPGQRVRWRDTRHAHAIGWLYTYGPGPFEVLRVVERGAREIPAGVVLRTDLGEREVNEVWLALDGPADEDRARSTRGLDVLVVEDDRDTADSLGLLLSEWGHRPLVACTGAAGWTTALAERPEVVLLDLDLPDVDGWTLARRLRGEPALQDVVLFAVTGCATDADRRRCYAAGIDHPLVKPVEPERLRRLLAALGAAPRPA